MAIEEIIPKSDDKKSEMDETLLEDIQNSEVEMANSPKKKKNGFCNWMKSIFKGKKVPTNVDGNDKVIDNYDRIPKEKFPRTDGWTWPVYLGIAMLVALVIGFIVLAVYHPLLAFKIFLHILSGR